MFDRRNHLRMAMAGGDHRDSGIEVEKPVAIHVFDDGALSAAHHQRIVARIGRREHLAVALHQRFGARAGQRSQDLRKVQTDRFTGKHLQSPLSTVFVWDRQNGGRRQLSRSRTERDELWMAGTSVCSVISIAANAGECTQISERAQRETRNRSSALEERRALLCRYVVL